ncbi:metallophosphoesterase [Desulfonispora thiosulfatigenes]|uniref:metallophosphoesterase n=1 Tax=Desulfonispora thiosulfatigenes TaxID=83661 RepID=UPI00190EC617|nr:metallophosphoesterase [Desulfonispora thiosulfatigenes]
MRSIKGKLILVLALVVFIIGFLYYENNGLMISHYKINSNKSLKGFKGFKIIHLSDLHSKKFGNNNKNMIKILKKETPDIIVITGDLIDRRKYDEDKSLKLIKRFKKIAPIYFVTGNHEGWSGKFNSLERKLENEGVIILRNDTKVITRGSDQIVIMGIDDPAFKSRTEHNNYSIVKKEISNMLTEENDQYIILLSHRPELFNLYNEFKIDLSLTGHAHGGQIAIPFIGALIAPNQGLFPKYYKGIHTYGESKMIVSRGLGNSIIPLRFFNRPEVVSITFD